MTKDEVIELCEKELDYYDIVNERSEMVDYGLIVEFLIDKGVIEIGGKK